MREFYRLLLKFVYFVINILFVLQIAIMIVVFLTAVYWFLNLIDVSAFDFAKPVADAASDCYYKIKVLFVPYN